MSITPQWANDEWCNKNCTNGGSTYMKITNVNGGLSGSLGWLDYNVDGPYFFWNNNTNPGHTFFINPPDENYSHKANMYFWDESVGGNKNDSTMVRNLTNGDYYGKFSKSNMDCTSASSSYSNVDRCRIGHGHTIGKSWDPQLFYANKDSINDQYWARDPQEGGFCESVKMNWFDMPFHKKKTRAFFFSGDADTNNGKTVPADYKNNKADNGYWIGCNTTNCPTSGSLIEACCPGQYSSCKNTGSQNNHAQWISDNTAAACCSLSASDALKHKQCGWDQNNRGAFNLGNRSNKCVAHMNNYCSNNWTACSYDPIDNEGGCTTEPGMVCDAYLRNSSVESLNTVGATISNYINSSTRDTSGRADIGLYYDYVSWQLYNAGNATSTSYYNAHKCTTQPTSDHCKSNPNDPCCRDDASDVFFYSSLPYLCNTPNTGNCTNASGNATGVCNDMLHYFCQGFNREDLIADKTLTSICGCSLRGTNVTQPYLKPSTPKGGLEWNTLQAPPQETSPYYDNLQGDQCDPLCLNCGILQCAGRCQATSCIMDNITLNFIGGDVGDITLEQECQGCGSTGCNCYFGGITVNDVSVSVGQKSYNQVCDVCYKFTDGDLDTAVEINCQTGNPFGPDGPGRPDYGEGGKPWYKRWVTIITLIIVGVLTLLGFGIGYYYNHKKVVQPEVEVYDPTDAYYNFDFSDFDFSGYE